MRKTILAALVFTATAASAITAKAELPQVYCYQQSQYLSWHNGYYDAAWGEPYALVVPPTAEFQANYGWGVCGTRVAPIYHQFGRPFPGFGAGGGGAFRPTPLNPSDTQQFGAYYVRGPW